MTREENCEKSKVEREGMVKEKLGKGSRRRISETKLTLSTSRGR